MTLEQLEQYISLCQQNGYECNPQDIARLLWPIIVNSRELSERCWGDDYIISPLEKLHEAEMELANHVESVIKHIKGFKNEEE